MIRFGLTAPVVRVVYDMRRVAAEILELLKASGERTTAWYLNLDQITAELDRPDIERGYLLRAPSGALIGLVVARTEPDGVAIRLTDLAIHPDYRRLGLGRMLLERAVSDYGDVCFDVAPDNVASLALVRGMGAKEAS